MARGRGSPSNGASPVLLLHAPCLRRLRAVRGRRRGGRGLLAQGRGERPAGRAELLAKKRASGRMQRPAELVPIPTDL